MHELIHEVSKYALKMGEEWRCGEGTEMMDALQSAQDDFNTQLTKDIVEARKEEGAYYWNGMICFPRIWCMHNRYTFAMKPVMQLLTNEVGCEGWANWGDPFAGYNSPAELTNDADPNSNAKYHMDALEWLKTCNTSTFDGVLYDPPYSHQLASSLYKAHYNSGSDFTHYMSQCKIEISRIIKSGGKAICFGWNSNGIGIKYGFKLVKGMILAHGGGHMNDTIVTVEVKL